MRPSLHDSSINQCSLLGDKQSLIVNVDKEEKKHETIISKEDQTQIEESTLINFNLFEQSLKRYKE